MHVTCTCCVPPSAFHRCTAGVVCAALCISQPSQVLGRELGREYDLDHFVAHYSSWKKSLKEGRQLQQPVQQQQQQQQPPPVTATWAAHTLGPVY